jgi:two-component system CheB/CheR fusion protein
MEIESTDKHGYWYAIRIVPYRTLTNHIEGVIISFSNVHAQKKAETKLKQLKNDLDTIKDFNHTILNAISNSTIILNRESKIILANYQFLKQYNLTNKEIIGQSIYTINLAWDKRQLKKIITQIFNAKSSSHHSTIEISPDNLIEITAHRISSSSVLLILNHL